jgi:hypothetical protein
VVGVVSEPEQDPNLTRQGFIKADRLTQEQLEGIVGLIEQGFVGGKATRQHGTSFTQFWRRVQREPELLARRREPPHERRRAEGGGRRL